GPGEVAGDHLISIENILAGRGDDTLSGNASANTLSGGNGIDRLFGHEGDDTLNGENGADTLNGGAGADVLDGGNGVDTADYADAAVAVTVDLVAGTGAGGEAQGDSYISIENATGGEGDDVFVSNNLANRFDGGSELDTNIVDYSQSDDGLNIDLRLELQDSSGYATGDRLISIQNVIGSNYEDTLFGDDEDNELLGGAGNDDLIGDGGDDWLSGGGGKDEFRGGDGNDRYVFSSIFDSPAGADNTLDKITEFIIFGTSQDKIDLFDMDANSNLSGNQAFTFALFEFTGKAGQLHVVVTPTNFIRVEADVNGDRQADFALLVNSRNKLSASSFIL
ncbi:MAG: calcium-binding protein, partial [Phyllobacterium sp.]